MKIIKNEKVIVRNGKIGQWTFFASVAVFGVALYINIRNISGEDLEMAYWVLIGFVVGYILMQISLYYANRYGRSPRPDEKLDAGLKGLPGDYSIYHFMLPASHLLVGPAGVWALIPYRQRGTVTYQKNRFRLAGGGFLQGYMSIFGQEGIGRPDLEAQGEIDAVKKLLAKSIDETNLPPVHAVLVFTHEEAELQVEEAPIPALKLKQLKDFLRQKAKEKPLNQTQLAAVKAALPQ